MFLKMLYTFESWLLTKRFLSTEVWLQKKEQNAFDNYTKTTIILSASLTRIQDSWYNLLSGLIRVGAWADVTRIHCSGGSFTKVAHFTKLAVISLSIVLTVLHKNKKINPRLISCLQRAWNAHWASGQGVGYNFILSKGPLPPTPRAETGLPPSQSIQM